MSKVIIFLGALGGVVGAVLAAQRASKPSAEFWTEHGNWVIAAIGIAAVIPPLQAAISELGERGRRKAAELETTLHPVLGATLILLVKDANVDWRTTGVQVFKVKGRLWWKHQARVAKMRLAHIAPSGIKWKRGKGLIGKCWETGEPQSKNLDAHFRPHQNISEIGWGALPSDFEKYGLNFKEFQRINDKYGLVAVFPLTREDKYIGCITADLPPDYSANVSEAVVLETLSAVAPSISAIVAGG